MGVRSLSAASISTGIKRSKFWDQSAVITGTYESISTVYLSSANAATVDFTNIPNTFMHLELRYSAASDRTNNFLDDINVRFGNGSIDTGSLTNRYGLFTGSWQSTNAITHIRLELANSNWLRYSHFALYGIRES